MSSSHDLFAGQPGFESLPMADAAVSFWREFYAAAEADVKFSRLLAEIPWRQERIRVWGKEHLQPRLSAWYADPGTAYAYSGLTLQALPWSPLLADIRRDMEAACGRPFNSVLLNLYRDQHDCMGWHTDDEAELGQNPVIASLSLGAARSFKFKHKGAARRAPERPLSVELTNGSLLLMAGSTQHHWQHAIAKQRALCGPRINLTFRTVFAHQGGGFK